MSAPEGNPATGGWTEPRATALLVLADGTVIEGFGLGATGEAPGEVCFNTAMTGYQEILTDPSYAGQIITFTFPHIGNVGANDDDTETVNAAASSGVRGVVLRAAITEPSNWRASRHFDAWLKSRGIVGICGVDTRALTALIRDNGMPNAIIAHSPDGVFDVRAAEGGSRAPARHGRARPRAARHLRPALRLGARRPGAGRSATASATRRSTRSSPSTMA